MAKKGYFILTDISGYTEFLTRSELDHAQDALRICSTCSWPTSGIRS